MLRKILVCLLVIGLLAGAASMATADDRVSIRFWAGCLSVEVIDVVLDMFAKVHPEIKVEFEYVPQGNMADRVTLAAMADDLPNLTIGYSGRGVTYYHAGLLESLNGTLTQEEIDDFLPGMLDLYTMDGILFSYPTYQVVITYIVNETLLIEAGCRELIPQNREITYDAWMQIAEKVSALPGKYATCLFAQGKSGDYYMLTLFQMWGANEYEGGDYTKITLNSEAGVKALEWMIDLEKKGYCPPGVAGITSRDFGRYAQSGSIAMFGGTPIYTQEVWKERWIKEGIADRNYSYIVVQTPHIAGVPTPGLFPSPTSVSVFRESDPKKREAAITMAKYLSSPECVKYIVGITGDFPARKSVKALILENPEYAFAMELLTKYGMADLGLNSPYYIDVRLARFPELQAAFMGTKTAKEALDDFAEIVEAMWE